MTTKYLHLAKKAGTKVATVNPYREPGMERYWVPSTPESALFGTKITDRFFQLDTGGDAGFLAGAMKALIENGWVDREFVDARTTGFDELRAKVEATSVGARSSGSPARPAPRSRRSRGCSARRSAPCSSGRWASPSTRNGEDNVRAIVNLALARGFVGREGCGLMPIRGHSGVQGGAEMGCYATAFPGGGEVSARERRGAERPVGLRRALERRA